MSSTIISGYPAVPLGDQTWINIARAKQSGAASQLAMDRGRGEVTAIEIDQRSLSTATAAAAAADVGVKPGSGLYIMA
jgi:hypothetical protein